MYVSYGTLGYSLETGRGNEDMKTSRVDSSAPSFDGSEQGVTILTVMKRADVGAPHFYGWIVSSVEPDR